MSSTASNLTQWMIDNGWRADMLRQGYISPAGSFVPAEIIEKLVGIPDDLRDARNPPPPERPWNVYDQLRMRLKIPKGHNFGLDHVHIAEGANQVHIFLVHADKALIVSDDVNLFPSDATVAKVRLFMEAVK